MAHIAENPKSSLATAMAGFRSSDDVISSLIDHSLAWLGLAWLGLLGFISNVLLLCNRGIRACVVLRA